MASPVPAEFVPLGIEPPNAPNFADPQLIGNIYEHVENLPMERLRPALDAFLAYKDGLLQRVLQVYVTIKAVVNVFGPGINFGSAIFQVTSEAKEILKVMLTIPLKKENSRALLNALLLLYANDRVSTQIGATVDVPGVFLMRWLTCWGEVILSPDRNVLDGAHLKGWFMRADDLKIDTFLVMPPGRALADCFKKLSILNDSDALVNPKIQRPQEPEAPSAGELEVEWEEWLRTWTKQEQQRPSDSMSEMRRRKKEDKLLESSLYQESEQSGRSTGPVTKLMRDRLRGDQDLERELGAAQPSGSDLILWANKPPPLVRKRWATPWQTPAVLSRRRSCMSSSVFPIPSSRGTRRRRRPPATAIGRLAATRKCRQTSWHAAWVRPSGPVAATSALR